jgi:hypothetical protein
LGTTKNEGKEKKASVGGTLRRANSKERRWMTGAVDILSFVGHDADHLLGTGRILERILDAPSYPGRRTLYRKTGGFASVLSIKNTAVFQKPAASCDTQVAASLSSLYIINEASSRGAGRQGISGCDAVFGR